MSNDITVSHIIRVSHPDGWEYTIQPDETGTAVEVLYSEEGKVKTFGDSMIMTKGMALRVADAIREIASKL